MTEIWLILAINVAGLAFALGLARWLSARDTGTLEVRRVAAAIDRATKAFLRREYKLIAASTLALGVVLFAANAVLPRGGGSSPRVGIFAAFGALLGSVLCCGVAHAAAHLTLRASSRALVANQVSFEHALNIALRAGAATALFAETASGLTIVGGTALLVSISPTGQWQIAAHSVGLFAGVGLGAMLAALLLQRVGSTYHTASDLAADLAGERDGALDHDDARNPAVVSDLVGDHVGGVVTRAADQFASATLGYLVCALLGAALMRSNAASFGGGAVLLTLPLLVRSSGVLGTVFGSLSVRSNDVDANAAIWRGQLSAALVSLAGVAGAALWLVGDRYAPRICAAAALGLLATSAVAHLSRYRTERRFTPVREALDAVRVGEAPTVIHGVGVGLRAVLTSSAVVGIALFASWQLVLGSGIERGGLLGLLLAVAAMLSGAPYLAAIAQLSSIADNARGMGTVARAAVDADLERRTARLDDTGFTCGAVGRNYLAVSGGLTALLASLAVPLHGRSFDAQLSLDFGQPLVLLFGALGAGAVLAYAGTVVQSSVRAAKALALEVERQLRVFPRERGVPQVPRDFAPSYRTCIELSARLALDGRVVSSVAAFFGPLALGIGLRLLYPSGAAGVAAEALASFAVVASVTGLGAALAVEGTRATLAAARRASPSREGSPSFRALLSADAIGDVLGNSAAPAAHLLTKAAAVAALAVAPFLT